MIYGIEYGKLIARAREREPSTLERFGIASFGITEAIAAVITSVVASIGVGATTAGIIGGIGAGALEGAALGALTDPRNPLKGAEFGAISGGVLGAAGPIASGLGVPAGIADVVVGGAGGVLGGLATGQNLGVSALEGAAGGLLKGSMAGDSFTSSAPAPGASAAATAAPSSVPTNVPGQAPATGTGTSLSSPQATPGAVGVGAGTGTPSNVSGVNAPTDVGASTVNTGFGTIPTPGSMLSPSNLDIPNFTGAATGAGATAAPTPTAAGTGAAGASAPAAGAADHSFGSFLKSPEGMLAAGGLALEGIKGNMKPSGFGALQTEAKGLLGQGTQDQSYLRSGTLPPGLEAGLQSATTAAEATIKQQYANSGMSGSSAEAQDIASLKQRSFAQGADIAFKLLQEGVSETQMGSELYLQLMQIQMAQDAQLSQGIGNFVSAFAGMGKQPTAPASGVA